MFCEVMSEDRHALVTTSPVFPTRVIPLHNFRSHPVTLTTATPPGLSTWPTSLSQIVTQGLPR